MMCFIRTSRDGPIFSSKTPEGLLERNPGNIQLVCYDQQQADYLSSLALMLGVNAIITLEQPTDGSSYVWVKVKGLELELPLL